MDLERLKWICDCKKECDAKENCDVECRHLDDCLKIEFVQSGIQDLKKKFFNKFPDKLETLQIIEVLKSETRQK